MRKLLLVLMLVQFTVMACPVPVVHADSGTQQIHPDMATPSAPAAWYIYWWYITHGYGFGEFGPTMSEIWWWCR